MWPWKKTGSGYLALDKAEAAEETCEPRVPSYKAERPSLSSLFYLCTVALIFLSVGFLCGENLQDNRLIAELSRPNHECSSPSTRREWRSLSTAEKEEYLTAVGCLMAKPSILNLDGSFYDDFSFVHNNIGNYSHNAAPFLSWHRYFIHVLETKLRTICGLKGHLPYWDWTLDWEHLELSPIFSNITGFGGDGDVNAEKSVGYGHCVTNGHFADFMPALSGFQQHSHCLSRGFWNNDTGTHGVLAGDKVQPAAVEAVLNLPTYEEFFLALESGPHNQIPNGIRGDFMSFTAPNDPIFYLHHAQLDRLWWKWQEIDRWRGRTDYGGAARQDSTAEASLDDVLPMGTLAPDIRVKDIMDTQSGDLCYRY